MTKTHKIVEEDQNKLNENAGEEKAPDSTNPAADDEHVGKAHELDPGLIGNAGQPNPNDKEEEERAGEAHELDPGIIGNAGQPNSSGTENEE